MQMFRTVASLVCLVALSACAQPTARHSYDVQKEIMIGSPSAFRVHVDRCVAQLRSAPLRSAQLITMAQVSSQNGVQIVCERIMRGVQSGKMTYDVYLDLFSGNYSADVVGILRQP